MPITLGSMHNAYLQFLQLLSRLLAQLQSACLHNMQPSKPRLSMCSMSCLAGKPRCRSGRSNGGLL